MTMPAIAPPLRPLFVSSVCPPCDGGNMLAVVASIAELSAFNEDDSLVVDDKVVVGRFSKLCYALINNAIYCTIHHGMVAFHVTTTYQCWLMLTDQGHEQLWLQCLLYQTLHHILSSLCHD